MAWRHGKRAVCTVMLDDVVTGAPGSSLLGSRSHAADRSELLLYTSEVFHKSSNRAPSEMKTQLSFRLPTLAFEEQVHALTPSVTSQGRS